jgi:pimeloyl-ACP methyl ester carboxylesterase
MQITCAGVQTQYQQIGSGIPLILLHGWGHTWQTWYPIISLLSEHYQLIIPDLPGFGHSADPSTVWDSSDYADWLREFIQQTVGNKRYFLSGHSYGGKVASIFTATAKHPPEHLIVVDASGLPDPLTQAQQLQQTFLKIVPDAFKQRVSHALKRKVLEKIGSATDHLNSTDYQRKVLRKIVRENISSSLQKIAVPTTVIWGELDAATPLHQGRQFATLIPGAKLEIIAQADHFPFITQTQDFVKVFQAALQK